MSNDYLSTLSADARSRLSATFADLAYATGLAVTREDGRTVPIPPVLTPTVLEEAELRRRVRIGQAVSTSIFKVARELVGSADRELLLGGMAPFERKVVERSFEKIEQVPNLRVDFFVDENDQVRVLELNATIPAMQGYSDIAANAFIRAVGHARGFPERTVMELAARNGSNSQALLEALTSAWRARGGEQRVPTIALCARRNDAQLTELQYIARAMTNLGTPAFVITPDELSIEGEREIRAAGRRVDILYRHIFARRIDEGSALGRIVLAPDRFMVFNPIDAQLEAKVALAELSRASVDDALAARFRLTDEERELVRAAVPWTRRLVAGGSTDEAGAPIADLLAHVKATPERFVLKRSWDYGGKAVFVGAALSPERIVECFGEALDWPALVERCAVDSRGGGFVVQTFVQSPRRRQLVCGSDGEIRDELLYVDFSSYASVGIDPPRWGGVCRASGSPIVNIVGGGGVAPLLDAEVAKRLLG